MPSAISQSVISFDDARIRRLLELAVTVVMLGTVLAVPGCGGEQRLFPDTIALPAGFAPEGIAIGAAPIAYLGSRLDRTVQRVDLRTGRGHPVGGQDLAGRPAPRRWTRVAAGVSLIGARTADLPVRAGVPARFRCW